MTASVSRNDTTLNVVAATLYAEARGEPEEGQIWVVWVIKNRALKNQTYWGGNSMELVCLHPNQFECWNGKESIYVGQEPKIFENCKKIVQKVINSNSDPTGGCDHYNNPSIEGYPGWTQNCNFIRKIGDHQFYKSRL